MLNITLTYIIVKGGINMNKLELAISSIKYQRFRMIYPIIKAFHVGTIFEELNLPWGEFK